MDVGPRLILVVNAGSTSRRVSLVDDDDRARTIAGIEDAPSADVVAVGHRVVHGGLRFREPTVIDADVERALGELESMAPLHNAPALDAVAHARAALPGVRHVAVFDTAFHATLPESAFTYAVPARWREEWGIRRFGFHGISVSWALERAAALLERDRDALRLLVCHLGGGCSVTAVRAGRSVDTTMGFTPLEGPPMATRSGSIDPGVLLHLLRVRGLTPERLDRALNLESGLAGLADRGGDLRAIERAAPDDPAARLALDVYVHRIAAAAASMTASLDRLDAIVFTGGVGEHSATVREGVCARLGLIGVRLDRDANRVACPDSDVSAAASGTRVLLVAAREEVIIARETRRALASTRRGTRND